MDVLSITGLCKRYPTFALEDVAFSVRQGEIMGFIGRNGAGKTTTLKSLLNIVHPDAGHILFFGLPFAENELEIKRRIGFVSGSFDYYPRKKLRVITSVTRSFYPGWDDNAYRTCLDRFSLDESKTPAQLSAGMKVKYNLALALSHHAELLILDEPTSGLDPVSRSDLLELFLTLAREGTSILFSTHITSDLDQCADRITYLRDGHVLASESLEGFVGGYRVATLPEALPRAAWPQGLLGVRQAKHGFTALLTASAAAAHADLSARPADLETIMVHLEKE